MVNIGRSELNNVFENMRQLRNEVDSMKIRQIGLKQNIGIIGTVVAMMMKTQNRIY